MSAALERVIVEQQAVIDNLREQLSVQSEMFRGQSDTAFRQKEELFEIAAKIINVSNVIKLPDCWKNDKKTELVEYMVLFGKLRLAMMNAGWCFHCNTLTCSGECYDD
jgi:hypothetical protein